MFKFKTLRFMVQPLKTSFHISSHTGFDGFLNERIFHLDSIFGEVLVVDPLRDGLGEWGRIPHTQTDVINKRVFKGQAGRDLQAIFCTGLELYIC